MTNNIQFGPNAMICRRITWRNTMDCVIPSPGVCGLRSSGLGYSSSLCFCSVDAFFTSLPYRAQLKDTEEDHWLTHNSLSITQSKMGKRMDDPLCAYLFIYSLLLQFNSYNLRISSVLPLLVKRIARCIVSKIGDSQRLLHCVNVWSTIIWGVTKWGKPCVERE